MGGVAKRSSQPTKFARSGRTLRQRWRWVPLSVRLRFAQARCRFGQRWSIVRLLVVAVVGPIFVVRLLGASAADSTIEHGGAAGPAKPDDHRVLSLPIDERVPRLDAGDRIDLYLTMDDVVGPGSVTEVLDDAGLVMSVNESAFSVAVDEDDVAMVANAIRSGGVLVVRR